MPETYRPLLSGALQLVEVRFEYLPLVRQIETRVVDDRERGPTPLNSALFAFFEITSIHEIVEYLQSRPDSTNLTGDLQPGLKILAGGLVVALRVGDKPEIVEGPRLAPAVTKVS